jgi:hypothetical protein
MIMIPHETAGMHYPPAALKNSPEYFQKIKIVCIAEENLLLGIAPRRHVIHRPGIFYSQRPGHTKNVNSSMAKGKT